MSLLRAGGVMLVVLLAAGAGDAAEPGAAGPLPPPTQPAIAPAVLYAPPACSRPSAYDVWQNYGVDRYGRWRPRVAYTPYGAYYLYNGAPYPWAQSNPLAFQSFLLD